MSRGPGGGDDRLRRLLGREDVRAISRRYFVSNGFDGTLTCIGVVVGAVITGTDGATVLKVGVGAAVGLCTSAVWSVYEIERAETRAEVLRLERQLLVDLDDTQLERERRSERLLHAVASGLGPAVGVLVPLSPFLVVGRLLTVVEGGVVAVVLGVSVLAAFGAYMGSLSGQRWYVAAARMGIAGLVVAGLNLLVPG